MFFVFFFSFFLFCFSHVSELAVFFVSVRLYVCSCDRFFLVSSFFQTSFFFPLFFFVSVVFWLCGRCVCFFLCQECMRRQSNCVESRLAHSRAPKKAQFLFLFFSFSSFFFVFNEVSVCSIDAQTLHLCLHLPLSSSLPFFILLFLFSVILFFSSP